MSDDDHNNPPTTIREVGIHIGYLKDAQKRTNSELASINSLLSDIKDSQVKPDDITGLEVRLTKLEGFVDQIKTKIATAAIGLFVSMVLALYGLDKWFKG